MGGLSLAIYYSFLGLAVSSITGRRSSSQRKNHGRKNYSVKPTVTRHTCQIVSTPDIYDSGPNKLLNK